MRTETLGRIRDAGLLNETQKKRTEEEIRSIRDRARSIDKFRALSTVPAFVAGPVSVIDEYL